MPYKLSQDKRNNVKSLINRGEVTKNIVQATGVSNATVKRIKSEMNLNLSSSKGGRPAMINNSSRKVVRQKLRNGSLKNAKDTQKYLNQLGYPISYSGTRKMISQLGFDCSLKKKKSLITTKHAKARLRWAKEHRDWTVDQWKKVIYSDETRINLWGSDGAKYVYKLKGDPIRPFHVKSKVKHDKSLMMWGCMTSLGPGYACRIIEYPMNADLYTHILNTSYLDTIQYYHLRHEDIIFQQDGDPKHTSRKAKDWLNNNHVIYINDWPACSPDLNPIEHLWHHLKLKLDQYSTKPKNLDELWERIELEWNKFTKEDMQPYYEGLPKRIQEVIKAKGGYTKH